MSSCWVSMTMGPPPGVAVVGGGCAAGWSRAVAIAAGGMGPGLASSSSSDCVNARMPTRMGAHSCVKIMVKVVKSQPADHSTKGTASAVLTTDHVSV